MNIKIYQDRKLLNEDSNFGSENENLATTLIFEFPEYIEKDGVQIATKDLNKTIVFDIEGDNELPIYNDKFSFPYEITKLGEVVWNVCLKEKSTTEDMTDKLVWYSETMRTTFGKAYEGHNEITTEKIDAFNVITTILNEKIAEVETLKVDIGDYKAALDNKVDKEQGKGLSTNDFTNLLKAKLENLENYNDTEIRNLLNGSLKGVNYTASNGMLTFTKNDGSTISVDLPLELLIESGRYDEANKQIVLVLANGNSINIPVSSLLDDFYGKGETYNKTEIDNIIAEKQALIEKLEIENKSQQEEIDMLTADYKEGKAEGETAVVTDGLPKSKIKATVNGNSYQETTEGYNLLNTLLYRKAGVTTQIYTVDFTPQEDGGIKIKGTADRNIDFYLTPDTYGATTDIIILDTAKQYTMELVNNTSDNIRLFTGYGEKSINVIRNPLKYTPTNNISWYFIRVMSGETVDTIVYPLLYEGTEAKPYEPYTGGQASPNPNYEQDIEVIDGVNRFNPNNVTNEFLLNDGSGTLNTSAICTDYIEVEGNVLTVGSNINWYDIASFYDKDKNFISREIMSAGNTEDEIEFRTFKRPIPSNAKYVRYCCSIKTTKPMLNFINYDKYIPYGHIGLVQRGKSLIDFGKPTGNSVIENFSFENDTLSITSKKASFPYVYWNILDIIKKNAGKTLFLNFENIDFIAENKSLVQLTITNNGVSSYPQLIATGGVKRPYTIPEDVSGITKCLLQLMLNNSAEEKVVSINITRPILSFKENDTYEPYHYNLIPINLNGNSIAKVGEIADLLNIGVDGRVSIEKKNHKENLSDLTINTVTNTNDMITRILLTSTIEHINAGDVMSNYFKYSRERWVENPTTPDIIYEWTDTLNHAIHISSDLGITTTEQAREFIDGLENAYLYAQLLNPQTIPLPSIEPIELFEGTNIFELVTNLGTTLSVTYKVSNKKKILSLEERIAALESAVIGG